MLVVIWRRGACTKVMERPEPPCPTAGFDRLDIVIHPSVWDGTVFVVNFEAFEYRI